MSVNFKSSNGDLKTPKGHFEINWPLVTTYFPISLCLYVEMPVAPYEQLVSKEIYGEW